MTNQQHFFQLVDIATTRPLQFISHPKSQRAQAASQVRTPLPSTPRITQETLFQIVGIENISMSKSAQLDEINVMMDAESVGADRLRFGNKRGGSNKGRIVRDVNVEDDDNQTNQQEQIADNGIDCSKCFFKLTLQDTFGSLIYAIEMEKLPFLSGKIMRSGFPIHLGAKVMIKGSDVVHGVILMRRSEVDFIGGFVKDWNVELERKVAASLEARLKEMK